MIDEYKSWPGTKRIDQQSYRLVSTTHKKKYAKQILKKLRKDYPTRSYRLLTSTTRTKKYAVYER